MMILRYFVYAVYASMGSVSILSILTVEYEETDCSKEGGQIGQKVDLLSRLLNNFKWYAWERERERDKRKIKEHC